MDQMTEYNMKGVAHSDKLTETYSPTVQFLLAVWSVFFF